MTSIEQRQMAFGFGYPIMNYPYPDGNIKHFNRFYMFGNYYPEGLLKDFMPFFPLGF